MISEEGRARIAEAQRKRHAAQKPVNNCVHHHWIADEYIINSTGMALKWIMCGNCPAKKQVRES